MDKSESEVWLSQGNWSMWSPNSNVIQKRTGAHLPGYSVVVQAIPSTLSLKRTMKVFCMCWGGVCVQGGGER